ncbi:MAG: DUF72 domain-containing protein [Planctomycetota bacterium]
MAATAPKYWIGPSGWSYPDWEGIVYPARKPRGFKHLCYLARFFNAVEVNTSFYRIPTPDLTATWPGLVPADFRFAFKLTQAFTHDRKAFPPATDIHAYTEGVRPVREAGLLGPLLMQFPWSFRFTPDAVAWLKRLADAFPDFDRFVEVRHVSWAAPEALDALRDIAGYCNIDQPRLRECLGPTQHVFGGAAYVRLHGRNAAAWFRRDQPRFERYNYLYSPDELREWVRRLNEIAAEAHQVYVFANNHYRGQGPANALELRAVLAGAPVEVPPTLVQTFPRLAQIARPPAGQRMLFE